MTFSVGCNLPIVTAQNKNHFGTCLQFHSTFDGYLFVQVNKKSKELCFFCFYKGELASELSE